MVKKKAAKKKPSPAPPKVPPGIERRLLAVLGDVADINKRLKGVDAALHFINNRLSDLEDATHEEPNPNLLRADIRNDPDAVEAERTEWVPCDEADRTEIEKK